MGFNRLVGAVAGASALLLSVAACHGASPTTGYMPSATSSVAAPGGVKPADKDEGIVSTCGGRIHIIIAGIVNCRFHEKGYEGKFRLHDHTQGLILISPSEGTKRTKFTITGVAVGNGYFIVTDRRGNNIEVDVKVTL
jgi:hypothetical protein